MFSMWCWELQQTPCLWTGRVLCLLNWIQVKISPCPNVLNVTNDVKFPFFCFSCLSNDVHRGYALVKPCKCSEINEILYILPLFLFSLFRNAERFFNRRYSWTWEVINGKGLLLSETWKPTNKKSFSKGEFDVNPVPSCNPKVRGGSPESHDHIPSMCLQNRSLTIAHEVDKEPKLEVQTVNAIDYGWKWPVHPANSSTEGHCWLSVHGGVPYSSFLVTGTIARWLLKLAPGVLWTSTFGVCSEDEA